MSQGEGGVRYRVGRRGVSGTGRGVGDREGEGSQEGLVKEVTIRQAASQRCLAAWPCPHAVLPAIG